MQDLIIAVGGGEPGLTPPMPFVGKRFNGADCTSLARLLLEIALLRCGFDISDRRVPVSDAQELVLQANRAQADCIVMLSMSAFGSRKSFNDVCGGTVRYSIGRQGGKSRELAEDICAKLFNVKKCATAPCDHAWNGASCPAVVAELGYLTDFDEAKAMSDPDYLRNIAEYVAMGICEYFGMPYILPTPTAYKDLTRMELGMRGKRIKLLQAALCSVGHTTDIDGVYGKATDLAVKTFTIDNSCTENGGCGALNELFFVTPKKLVLGSKHSDVLYIQRKLCSKLYKSPLSGELCDDTVRAANEFLTETGNSAACADDGVTMEAVKLLSAIGGGRPRLF